MRKFNILLVGILFFCSCDSWIDLKPETDVTYTNFFKTEEDAEAVTMEIFARGRYAFGEENYHSYMGAIADIIQTGFFSPPIESIRELDPAVIGEKLGFEFSWRQIYLVIYNCNLLLENAHRFEISKDKLDYWLAQAYFYKGLSYFMVARDWGDAPIPRKSTDVGPIGRSPAKEVLQEAIDNAEKALEMLPLYEDLRNAAGAKVASKQWGTKGAAAALLAHIYAWRGGLEKDNKDLERSEEYATLLLENKVGVYSFAESPEEVCTNALVKAGNESVFELDINFTDGIVENIAYHEAYNYVGYPHNMNYGMGDRFTGIILHIDRIEKMYPKVVEVGNEHNVLVNDLRRDAYFYKLEELAYDSAHITKGKVYMNKWRKVLARENSSGKMRFRNINQNKVFWRLSDIILLRAECRAKLNKEGAVADLNKIRQRAKAPLYPSVYDKEGLSMAIFREREKELLCEGHRYYDVVRNGLWKTELPPVFAALTDADIKNGALYFPVTTDAFEGNNDLMVQTPFWHNR